MSGDLSMPAANEPPLSGSGTQRLTDARMAVLLTEYLDLGEQELQRSGLAERTAERKPPRSYSLAHYESRGVEYLEDRRAQVLSTLAEEGMPTGHWIGYGHRAVLLRERPPGYPTGLELYDALWEVLEESSEDTPPIEITRASRRLEFRRSLSAPRRLLLDLYSGEITRSRGHEFGAIPITALIIFIFALSLALSLGASTGALVSVGMVAGLASLILVGELNSEAEKLQTRLMADLRAHEADRLPEPTERVRVMGCEAEIEFPDPDKDSPLHEAMIDVRFVVDGSRARVKADEAMPIIPPAYERNQQSTSRCSSSCC